MAGDTHSNPGLGWADRFDDFNDVIGQYPSNPLSSHQFIDVYHASQFMRPTDSGLPRTSRTPRTEGVVFAGSKRAADMLSDFKARPWVHTLRIPTNVIDPHLFGDDNVPIDPSEGPHGQMTMFEHTPIDPLEVERSGRVGMYRNMVEHRGSTSFIIPKSLFYNGVVQNVGVHPSQFHRDHLVNADGSPDIEGWKYISDRRKRS